MTSGEEPLPEPDMYGQLPYLHELAPQQELTESDFRIVVPGPETISRFIQEPSRYNRPALTDGEARTLIAAMGQMIRRSGGTYEEAYFGSLATNIWIPEPEVPPEPPRDPYPSRAGWRAPFVPPFDPTVIEAPKVSKGKIGKYEIVDSDVMFSDVGGNTHAKELLQEIALQFADPEAYEEWDVPVPKGVLLHGAPGTGKTLLAKAFAGEAGAAFIEISAENIVDKFFGESEKNLAKLFDDAAKHPGPVVIFIDEINSILPDRRFLPPGHPHVSMVETFLKKVDGLKSAKNVMILGATNLPDMIDAAASRPGRFDHHIRVELPDRAGCEEILARQLLGAERRTGRVLVEDELDIAEVSVYLQGLTGAGIAEVANRAKRTMVKTKRAKKAGTIAIEGVEPIEMTGDDTPLVLTTADLTGMATSYQLEVMGLSPNKKPGDDEPPTGVFA